LQANDYFYSILCQNEHLLIVVAHYKAWKDFYPWVSLSNYFFTSHWCKLTLHQCIWDVRLMYVDPINVGFTCMCPTPDVSWYRLYINQSDVKITPPHIFGPWRGHSSVCYSSNFNNVEFNVFSIRLSDTKIVSKR